MHTENYTGSKCTCSMNIHKSNKRMNVLNRQINKQNINSIPEPLLHSPFNNYSVPSTRITIFRLLTQWKGLFVFKLYINVPYVSGFFCSPLCFWDLSVSDFDPVPLRNYMFSDWPNSPHSTLPRLIFFRSPLATVFFSSKFPRASSFIAQHGATAPIIPTTSRLNRGPMLPRSRE